MNSTSASHCRKVYRAYRNGPIRFGHSFLRRALGLFVERNQTVELRSGLKVRLDLSISNQNAIFWNDNDCGLHLNWALRELVPLNGQFIDCGANCGLAGLLANRYRMARVIFIEPHPRLAATVAQNIKLNFLENACELVEAAVSDQPGELSFYENPVNDGGHSLHPEADANMKLISKVKVITLQEIIETRKLNGVDFLKVDTEGNDLKVLKSLRHYLTPSFVKVLFVEMTANQRDIFDLMCSAGYTGFQCVKTKRQQSVRLRKIYGDGGTIRVFEPLPEKILPDGDVLWVGKNSVLDVFLRRFSD
jgi:FkbM family methyltransferase